MSRRIRRLPRSLASIFAVMLAAVASVALSEAQPATEKNKVTQAAARPPKVDGDIVPVDAEPSPRLVSIDPPAPPGSTSPTLAAESATTVTQEHEILMTWLAPDKSGRRLQFSRLSGKTWSRPITVATSVSMLAPADPSSLTVFETQGVRRTLIARTGNVVARSGDAGRTWGRLPSPPLPFSSFAGGDEGGYAFWLAADGMGSAKLLGTRVLAGKTLLDPRVVYGSGTSAAMTWDGPVVVYRALNATDALDIAIVRRQDAQWTPPHPVYADGWRPAQPPKNGPHVAAQRRQVAVAWYTEATSHPRVLVAFSSNAGRTFSAPVEVDARAGDHTPHGSVAVTLDDNGDAIVLWKATTGATQAMLNLARVSPDGKRGTALVLAKGFPAHLGGIPQIVRADDRVAVTWLEGVLRRIRTVAVPLSDIPTLGSRPQPTVVEQRPAKRASGRGRLGQSIPDIELVSLDGNAVSLASLQGRAVLLNLWATWCRPCIQEMPELAALHAQYREEGLAVVGISVDSTDASDTVRTFVAKRKLPFVVWLDPEMEVSKALRVRGLPATFIIDRKGRIILRRDGAITAEDPELREALSRALGES